MVMVLFLEEGRGYGKNTALRNIMTHFSVVRRQKVTKIVRILVECANVKEYSFFLFYLIYIYGSGKQLYSKLDTCLEDYVPRRTLTE